MGSFWSQPEPVSPKPAKGCKLTREGLLDIDGPLRLFEDSLCPSCERRGVHCRVGNHSPSVAPALAVTGAFVIHVLIGL
jgi:hypothetical protein